MSAAGICAVCPLYTENALNVADGEWDCKVPEFPQSWRRADRPVYP